MTSGRLMIAITRHRGASRALLAALLAALAAGGCARATLPEDARPDAPGDDAGLDAPMPSRECTTDEDCDDRRFCDGRESCAPGDIRADLFGCVSAEARPCLPTQACVEEEDVCRSDCDLEDDADGDGAIARSCGGDDCDDSDRSVHPGAIEVCDSSGRDEDCDPGTLGADADGDGFPASTCCNGSVCGSDCDDENETRHPGAPEECNGLDDDCDGALDAAEDADRDGYVTASCGGLDCDDGRDDVHPDAPDACGGEDLDCSQRGALDVDLDGDGYSGDLGCSAGGILAPGDCDDRDASAHPSGVETCDGADGDCDGRVDESLDPCDAEIDVAVGDDVACALSRSGTVRCWGRNEHGECGDGTRLQRLVAGGPVIGTDGAPIDAIDIDASEAVACAALRDGRLACWGESFGARAVIQDGIGGAVEVGVAHPTGGLRIAVRTRAGRVRERAISSFADAFPGVTDPFVDLSYRTDLCAVTSRGQLFCTGRERGAPVAGVDEAIEVSDGGRLMVLLRDGRVLVEEGSSLVEDPSARATHVAAPCAVWRGGAARCRMGGTWAPALAQFTRMVTGRSATCVIRESGAVACIGARASGQLGYGVAEHYAAPQAVASIDDAISIGVAESYVSIGAGGGAVCARRASGQLWCWGGSVWGGALPAHTPREIVELRGTTTLAISGLMGMSYMAGRPDGRFVVWGYDHRDRLGVPSDSYVPAPTEVPAWGTATALALGMSVGCVLGPSGEVRCSGWDVGSSEPRPLAGLGPMSLLAGRDDAFCASDGVGLWCWGDYDGVRDWTPRLVPGAGEPAVIAVSDRERCTVDGAGVARCWGALSAISPPWIGHDAPAIVPGLPPVSAISTSGNTTCALASGEIWCWGYGGNGAMGTGAFESGPPTRVIGVDDAIAVAVGLRATCAVRGGGEVMCWGDDLEGSVGTGRDVRWGEYVDVIGLSP